MTHDPQLPSPQRGKVGVDKPAAPCFRLRFEHAREDDLSPQPFSIQSSSSQCRPQPWPPAESASHDRQWTGNRVTCVRRPGVQQLVHSPQLPLWAVGAAARLLFGVAQILAAFARGPPARKHRESRATDSRLPSRSRSPPRVEADDRLAEAVQLVLQAKSGGRHRPGPPARASRAKARGRTEATAEDDRKLETKRRSEPDRLAAEFLITPGISSPEQLLAGSVCTSYPDRRNSRKQPKKRAGFLLPRRANRKDTPRTTQPTQLVCGQAGRRGQSPGADYRIRHGKRRCSGRTRWSGNRPTARTILERLADPGSCLGRSCTELRLVMSRQSSRRPPAPPRPRLGRQLSHC